MRVWWSVCFRLTLRWVQQRLGCGFIIMLKRVGFGMSVRLGTALMDMYTKCGELGLARKIFDEMVKRDTVCWNVMIMGVAMHGDGKRALEMFSCMQKEGCRPDDATFIAVLMACSHSGMTKEGLEIFSSMRSVYQIEPQSNHYGCVVDFLCRANFFQEAAEIMKSLSSVNADPAERAIAWRAFLSACWKYGETKLAEVVAGLLLKLEVHSGVYVLLSNIYDVYGRKDESRKMRKCMKDRGVVKVPGCSYIELAWMRL